MNKKLLILVCLFCMGLCTTVKSQDTMNNVQKISYALGVNNGDQFVNLGIEIDADMFLKGLKDGLTKQNMFTMEEMQAIFMQLDQIVKDNQQKKLLDEKAKGAEYLAQNKLKEGVKETTSGLQYKVIVMGTGTKPLATDKVKVHYHGTLLDGTVFDSSVERGEPITFPLNGVIPGWTEGLQLMPIGSKFILYIPSDLAYGDRGNHGINPGATLIFEVELLDINPAGE